MNIRAIKYSESAERGTDYLVMAAHAGRTDRTGAKVHMAILTVWPTGRVSLGACWCSGNGHLKGSLVPGTDEAGFSRVSCKKCGCGPDSGTARNAKSEIIEVNL